MRQLLVVGNWKMHGTVASAGALLDAIVSGVGGPGPEVVVCPAYVHLAQAVHRCATSPVAVGAQDCSHMSSGAFTGEIAPGMLADLGCRWVILGHSERRQYHGESDAMVAAKLAAASDAGLRAIVCVGETREQRESGEAESVVRTQVLGALGGQSNSPEVVIAYEPVWAIGTGLTATPQQAQGMHCFIRECLAEVAGVNPAQSRVLYGGSVKADNAAKLFAQDDIDGALVGGASLVGPEFLKIVRAAVAVR